MGTDTKVDAKVLQKVGDLVRLANSADEEEARTAAIQATKLMKEHELMLVPRSELERIKTMVSGANALAKQYKDEAQQKMLIGALAGLAAAKVLKF